MKARAWPYLCLLSSAALASLFYLLSLVFFHCYIHLSKSIRRIQLEGSLLRVLGSRRDAVQWVVYGQSKFVLVEKTQKL
jgi:hypothetical protein